MACEFKITRQVEFCETDLAGIVHFSNFFRYMESAEQAFFRSLGFSIHPQGPGGLPHWPRVHADCDYRSPLRFEDLVEIHLLVRERRSKSIAYTFIFTKLNEQPAREVARGSLAVACAVRDPQTGSLRGVAIPPEIAAKIEAAPEEMFAR